MSKRSNQAKHEMCHTLAFFQYDYKFTEFGCLVTIEMGFKKKMSPNGITKYI